MNVCRYVAKCDWLRYSTNIWDLNLQSEIAAASAKKLSDRFYRYEYDTTYYNIRAGKKNGNLKSSMVQCKKEILPCIEELGMPVDGTISRCDICIDCDTFFEAQALTTLEFSAKIVSRKDEKDGETWYYGEREQQLFERVYMKFEEPENLKDILAEPKIYWRYELEIKPNSKSLPVKKWLKIDKRVRDKYGEILAAFRNPGYDIGEILDKCIPYRRQEEIKFIILCPYIDDKGKFSAWDDFTSLERDFAEQLMKVHKEDDNARQFYKLVARFFKKNSASYELR